MNSRGALPPYARIEGALRATTARLASEIAHPSADPPAWDEFEWAVARAVCAMQGLAALLANRLKWQGPQSWSSFLIEQRHHSRAHYERAGEILASIDAAARNSGIRCIALKGSALRPCITARRAPDGRHRLLVAPATSRCAAMLSKVGYEIRRAPRVFIHRAHGRIIRRTRAQSSQDRGTHASPNVCRRRPWTSRAGCGRKNARINPYASRVELLRHILLHRRNMRRMRFASSSPTTSQDSAVCSRRRSGANCANRRRTPGGSIRRCHSRSAACPAASRPTHSNRFARSALGACARTCRRMGCTK